MGRAVTDNAAFKVDLPHRESLSPDAGFYVGPLPGMKFFDSPPAFAAEVRSESDYGPKAEKAIRQKRLDYFTAGTAVVWDVDLLSEEVVRVYRQGDAGNPTVYRRGDVAEAEPAVPGWKMPVDELFERQTLDRTSHPGGVSRPSLPGSRPRSDSPIRGRPPSAP